MINFKELRLEELTQNESMQVNAGTNFGDKLAYWIGRCWGARCRTMYEDVVYGEVYCD